DNGHNGPGIVTTSNDAAIGRRPDQATTDAEDAHVRKTSNMPTATFECGCRAD
ncbi:hypothetical protein FRC15_007510, partial [Serendipita sp. 397]